MEDFLNLHGISRSDLKEKDRRVSGNKRNSKFVRSDALSPNSVNRLIIETELEKINRRNTNKTGGELRVNLSGNNNENKIELGLGTGTGTSVKNCFVRLKSINWFSKLRLFKIWKVTKLDLKERLKDFRKSKLIRARSPWWGGRGRHCPPRPVWTPPSSRGGRWVRQRSSAAGWRWSRLPSLLLRFPSRDPRGWTRFICHHF